MKLCLFVYAYAHNIYIYIIYMYLYLFDIDLHKTVRWPLEKMFEIQQTKQKSMTQSLLHNVCFYCIKFHVGSSGDEIISKHRDIADIA